MALKAQAKAQGQQATLGYFLIVFLFDLILTLITRTGKRGTFVLICIRIQTLASFAFVLIFCSNKNKNEMNCCSYIYPIGLKAELCILIDYK